MSSVLTNALTLTQAVIASEFPKGLNLLALGQVKLPTLPTSGQPHQGDNNIFLLTKNTMNFQLLGSTNDITFIAGNDDFATFVGGGSQKIFDAGTGTSLSFSAQSPGALIAVLNADHDSRLQLYLHDFVDQSIRPDGQGGTLIGGQVDLVNAAIAPTKVHFVNDPTFVAAAGTGLYPLPGPAGLG